MDLLPSCLRLLAEFLSLQLQDSRQFAASKPAMQKESLTCVYVHTHNPLFKDFHMIQSSPPKIISLFINSESSDLALPNRMAIIKTTTTTNKKNTGKQCVGKNVEKL